MTVISVKRLTESGRLDDFNMLLVCVLTGIVFSVCSVSTSGRQYVPTKTPFNLYISITLLASN